MSVIKSVFKIGIPGIFVLTTVNAADAVVAASSSTQAANSVSGLTSMLPMIVILIAFMYLLVIRPQSKRVKAHRALMASLEIGDEVVTTGGIFGKISKITDESIILEVASNVEIKVQRTAIVANLPKGTVQAV
jgi:preprotein translocase subunit YajC